jgi:hypothetical protein
MLREQRVKYEMFVRVRNFGIANRSAFPEESGGGKKFGQLAAVVASIEEQLVRRLQARTEARKVKTATKQAALEGMKAIAATGRRAAIGESAPHPFRMPSRSSATVVLTSARLFSQEAAERKEKFMELGMPPTFLEDFDRAVQDLADAVVLKHDSRGARKLADAAIDAALARGMAIVADLDVTVPNALGGDLAKRAQYVGARRLDQPPSPDVAKPPVASPASGSNTAAPKDLELKIAS